MCYYYRASIKPRNCQIVGIWNRWYHSNTDRKAIDTENRSRSVDRNPVDHSLLSSTISKQNSEKLKRNVNFQTFLWKWRRKKHGFGFLWLQVQENKKKMCQNFKNKWIDNFKIVSKHICSAQCNSSSFYCRAFFNGLNFSMPSALSIPAFRYIKEVQNNKFSSLLLVEIQPD